jgi:hypothetical protein
MSRYTGPARSHHFKHLPRYLILTALFGVAIARAGDTKPPEPADNGKPGTVSNATPIVPPQNANPAPAPAAPAPKTDPSYLTIDLASVGDKFVVDSGQYTLKFINQLPVAQYTRSTKLTNSSIPAALDLPGSTSKPPAPTPFTKGCDAPFNNLEQTLNGMMCEAQVSHLRATAASMLTAMGCAASDIQQYTAKFAALTEYTSPNSLPAMSNGDKLTVTVTRGPVITAAKQLEAECGAEKLTDVADGSGRKSVQARNLGVWEFDVGKLEAQWLTLYGFNFASSGNEDYFSNTNSGATPVSYTITRKNSAHGSAFSPSVYFMRMPAEEGLTDWMKIFGWRSGDVMGGLIAGVGFDFDNPTVFLGYGIGWGYNVVLTGGVVMHKEDRLNGQYTAGQVIKENLTTDQLTESTYKPRAYVGLAFRFGSNPFSSSKSSTPASTTKSATPAK